MSMSEDLALFHINALYCSLRFGLVQFGLALGNLYSEVIGAGNERQFMEIFLSLLVFLTARKYVFVLNARASRSTSCKTALIQCFVCASITNSLI